VARPIVMPSFGMYTAEGTLTAWTKPSGAWVESGETVLEIETEKAVQEVQAPLSGVLHHVVDLGARLQVESLIGYVLERGEAPPASPADASHSVPNTPVVPVASAGPRRELRASPLAKRLAAEHGIDLSHVRGTGPEGRIVEADIRAALSQSAVPQTIPQLAPARRIPLSLMRRRIGERLRSVVDTAVPVTLMREVRAEALVSTRAALMERLGQSIPYDAFFIKLLAAGLRQFPQLNATIEGGELVVFSEINIGFAVALEDGLVVPVVRAADTRTLIDVTETIGRLSAKAKAGQLEPSDTAAGTATITNLGGHGIDGFTPVLNPPQAIVLGIGRIQSRPVVEGTSIVPGITTVLSLTFDHRVTDGANAAKLLNAVGGSLVDEARLTALSS
jgi:pyruvate dehydrogenase E2 component (dihydrolipoamide acetyltransferase)